MAGGEGSQVPDEVGGIGRALISHEKSVMSSLLKSFGFIL